MTCKKLIQFLNVITKETHWRLIDRYTKYCDYNKYRILFFNV